MKDKKVSVIMSCWNTGEYLRPCLDSLFAQDYKNFELIAVDDCSTDNTYSILCEYAKRANNMIVLRHEHNRGLSAGRNTGYAKASGDYILFCDSDDVVTKDYIRTLVENMQKADADISIAGFKRVKEGQKLAFQRRRKVYVYEGLDAARRLFRQKTFDICVWNKLYKREILQKYNLLFHEDVLYAEDIAFNYNYFKHVRRAVYDSKICYFYIRRSTGLVKTPISPRKLSSFIDVDYMIKDSESSCQELVPYTRGWASLVSLEFLYYCKKYKYNDPAAIKMLLNNMKTNLPYLKKAKTMIWYRRHLTKYGYYLAKLLLGSKVKERAQ